MSTAVAPFGYVYFSRRSPCNRKFVKDEVKDSLKKDLDVGFVEGSEILDIILGLDHHKVDVAARTHVVENTSPARSQVKSDFQRKR